MNKQSKYLTMETTEAQISVTRRGSKNFLRAITQWTTGLLILLALTLAVKGQDYVYSTDNGSITITGYVGSDESAIIPYSIEGLPVTAIEDGAFALTSLTSVTIPDSVTRIGSYAFFGCPGLTNVVMPSRLSNLEDGAFWGCSSLGSITIPGSTTNVGSYTFYDCTNLLEIHFQGNAPVFGEEVFTDSTNVTVYYLPGTTGWGTTFDGRPTVKLNNKDFTFEANDGSIILTRYIGTNKEVSIPITIAGLPVTCIGRYAFGYPAFTNLTSVIIPDSVTNIDEGAFASCWNLRNIRISSNLTTIRTETFYDCSSLDNVIIPNNVRSIELRAFSFCTQLSNITMGSVTNIGEDAFSSCTNLTNIRIPSSVISIGDGAFACAGLTDITIPNSITSIGDWAFYRCTGLTDMTLPNSVLTIANAAFYQCTSLTNITIPNSILSIGDEAFYQCNGLTKITIPDSINSIGESAFEGCTNLPTVTIPQGVTSISASAFDHCINLVAINVSDFNSSYSSVDGVLFNKAQTSLIRYPEGKAEHSYTIPNSATSIDTCAFRFCTNLTTISIPSSVTEIKDLAFSECSSLRRIHFEGAAPSLGKFVFRDTYFATIFYLAETTGWQPTLGGCPTILWDPLAQFRYTTNNGLLTITDYLGTNDSITIPNTIDGLPVTSIGQNAFDYAIDLTQIAIPKTVTNVASFAFNPCINLTTITVNEQNPNYTSVNGVLFNKKKTTLIKYPRKKTEQSYTIPNSVTSIGETAFASCDNLTNIVIPNSVLKINDGAFSGCASLGCITIPNSVKNIGPYVFWCCTGITNVSIPNSVTNIGTGAFGYSGLTSVTIPKSVKTIGSVAFGACFNLRQVFFQGNAPITDESAFYVYTDNVVGYYLPGTTGWAFWFNELPVRLRYSDYAVSINNGKICIIGYIGSSKDLSIPNQLNGLPVTSIGDCAFYGFTNLTSVTIPNSVTNIGWDAFAFCTSLAQISISANIKNIEDYAFYSCYNLTEVFFQGTQPIMGADVFYGDNKAKFFYLPGITGWASSFYDIPTVQRCSDYACEVNDGTINITGYLGSARVLTIPSMLNGLPVTGIQGAFFGCTNLTSVTIPNSITNIGNYAFFECTGLTNVTIASNSVVVAVIPAYPERPTVHAGFSDPAIFDPAITNVPVINSFLSMGHTNPAVFHPSATNLTVINCPVSIGDWVFAGCTNLTSITIPDRVTSIGERAFSGCARLTGISIPKSVTQMGDVAFEKCTGLRAISVAASNPNYCSVSGVLFDKNKTRLIQYPSDKTGSDYTVPNGVTRIEDYAFYGCTHLSSVNIPSNVSSLGSWSFASCPFLHVYFNGNAPRADESAFSGADYAILFYQPGTTGWDSAAFPGIIMVIQGFTYTIENETVTITGFPENANVRIPETIDGLPVTGIEVTNGIYSPVSITIPASVKKIGNHAFDGCFQLEAIKVSEQNTAFSSLKGILFNKNKTTLIRYPLGIVEASYTIPSNVNTIANFAFDSCHNLSGVTIPNSVKSIGDNAFIYCGLTSVTIPDSVTNIGDFAFGACSFTQVTIPSRVIHLGVGAFSGRGRLNNITVSARNVAYTSVDGVVFDKSMTTLIECPEAKTGSYVIPRGVITIADYAFAGSRLSNVTVPGSVTNIGVQAFAGCCSLDKIYFQGNLPSFDESIFLDDYATFYGDYNLTVYYYSGTKGWGLTFCGRPTVCIDLHAPTLTITSPKAGLRASNTVYELTATGTCKDDIETKHVVFRVGNGEWTCATTTNGWTNWCAVLPLTPGTNKLQVFCEDTSANRSATTTVSFVYVPLAALTVTQSGLGKFTPAFTNGQLLALGTSYTVTATGIRGFVFSNWSGTCSSPSNVVKFTMTKGTVLGANFVHNPFTVIAGDYWGVFAPESGMAATNSGGFSARLNSDGTYSGKLYQGTTNYPLCGHLQFSLGGLATNTVTINKTKLTVVLNLTRDNGEQIEGTVGSTAWTAELKAVSNPHSPNPHFISPYAGRYTMVVPGSTNDDPTLPIGYSVASINVSPEGTMNVQGYAADGSSISCASIVSQQGRWPLYASLGNSGFLIGWPTLSRTNYNAVEGSVNWVRPAGTALYPAGFNYLATTVFGSVYTNQFPLLNFTNATLMLTGGNLANDFSTRVSLIRTNVTDLNKTNALVVTMTPTTGLFSGSVTNRAAKKTIPFKGVLLQNENVGVGAFKGTNQTGEVFLGVPQP